MRRNLILFLILGLIGLVAVGVALAAYTGPNRTITELVRDPDHHLWTLTHSNPPQGFPSPCYVYSVCPGEPPSVERQLALCGWVAENSSCTQAFKEETTNLPPATVAGAFACVNPGENGWCLAGGALDLAAHEPLSGHVITAIEGATGILCDPPDAVDVACSWSGAWEGQYAIEFWALSSYRDTSLKGSATWKQDGTPPVPGVDLSGGTAGIGGWYRGGPLGVTADGWDAVSGVSGGEVSLEGGAWQPSGTISLEGWYDIQVRVRDYAGNQAAGSSAAGLDNTPPQVMGDIQGTAGEGGWYRSSVTASAAALDALSDVASAEASADGGPWQTVVTVSGDGPHNVAFRARDRAGNDVIAEPLTVRIDATLPASAFLQPVEGSEITASGVLELIGSSADATSGLARVELAIGGQGWHPLALEEGGVWHYAWDTRSVPNGRYVVQARAWDIAGNGEATAQIVVQVVDTFPAIDIPDRWTIWEQAPIALEEGAGLAELVVEIDGGTLGRRVERYGAGSAPAAIVWDRRFDNGALAPPGEYLVSVVVHDVAGSSADDEGVLVIPPPPTATATATPTMTPTPTPTPTATPLPLNGLVYEPSPTPTATVFLVAIAPPEVEAAAPAIAEPPPAVPPEPARLWWPVGAMVGLAGILVAAAALDPRPPAWKRLGDIRRAALASEERHARR